MRLLIVAGVAVFSATAAFGAYLIELDGGDRMTVDRYWEDGGRMHLSRGGVDMSVPSGRVKGIHEVSGPDEAGIKPGLHPTTGTGAVSGSPSSGFTDDTKRDEVRIARHVVKVSRELSIARARGDAPTRVKHLERELSHTEGRWRSKKDELGIR
ncbi:MAG TPA: hypothetical protein VKU61_09295 [Candidatus Binatia bacterium]|nr:hypothetical protein [Candidatus Binatia bacterium]